MELDDMKNLWDQSGIPTNANIAEMMNAPADGPLPALKKTLKYTIGFFMITVVVFGGDLLSSDASKHGPAHWLLFGILFIEFLIAILNLGVVNKMQVNEGNVQQNLTSKIGLLKHRLKGYLYLNTALFVVMAVLLEVTLSHHWDKNFEGWSTVSPMIRYPVYSVFITGQHLIKLRTLRTNYGQHLYKLEQLVQQMN